MMPFQNIRTLSTQAADATPPASTLFVALNQEAPLVEIAFDASLSLGGTPTSVTFTVWRQTPEGLITKLGDIVVAAANIGTIVPQIFELAGLSIFVTVSFVGGTSPTVTGGAIWARPYFD